MKKLLMLSVSLLMSQVSICSQVQPRNVQSLAGTARSEQPSGAAVSSSSSGGGLGLVAPGFMISRSTRQDESVAPVSSHIRLDLAGKLSGTDLNVVVPASKRHQVVELNLRGNGLKVITQDLANFILSLSNLKGLHLDDNKLESLPNLGDLTSLEVLSVSNNPLRTLPILPRSIKTLGLKNTYVSPAAVPRGVVVNR